MAQAHGDRLTAMDASFLAQEGPSSHMHVGAVMIFEGPPPAYDDFVDQIRSRLHLVPRYRQKLAFPPLETGRPLWIDDPSFNLEYHVRHTALPHAGLRGAAARARRAHPLPAARPREAAVGDVARPGARGQPLRADLQDPPRARRRHLRRRPRDRAVRPRAGAAAELPHEGEPWAPQRRAERARPRRARHPRAGADCRSSSPAARLAAARASDRDARRGARGDRGRRRGRLGGARTRRPRRRSTSPIGPHRRLAFVRDELADFKLVKNAFGGTVNDVVLAVVAGGAAQVAALARRAHRGARAARARARSRSAPRDAARPARQPARGDARAAAGLRRGPGRAAARRARRRWTGSRSPSRRSAPRCSPACRALAPPTILAQASRLNFSTRLFNLLVTNVPGPQFPLYVLGRELQDLFPVAFLPQQPRARGRDHVLQRRAWTSACSATTTRCPTSTRSASMVALEELPRQAAGGAAATGAPARERRSGASVAERELRVLGHLVRRPRGREDHGRARPRSTPGSSPTNSCICSETCGPIGQAGVVSVNVTFTVPPSISTP